MANNSDIEVVIGVNSVATKVEIEEGIRKVLNEINKSNKFAGNNGLKIGVNETSSKTQISTNLKEVFKKLNTDVNNSFKINNVSLSNNAVNTLKKQLETALSSINIKGVSISGISKNTSTNSKSSIGSNAVAKSEIVDNDKIVTLYKQFEELEKKIKNSSVATEKLKVEMRGLKSVFAHDGELNFSPFTNKQFTTAKEQLNKLKTSLAELEAKGKKLTSNTLFTDTAKIDTCKNKILGVIDNLKTLDINTSNLQSRLTGLLTELNSPTLTTTGFKNVQTSFTQINSEIKNLKAELNREFGISNVNKNLTQLTNNLKKAYAVAKNIMSNMTAEQKTLIPPSSFSDGVGGNEGVESSYKNATKLLNDYKIKLEEVKSKLSELHTLEKGTSTYNTKHEELAKLKSELSNLGAIATKSVNSVASSFNNLPKTVNKAQNSVKALENLMSHMSTWAAQNDRAFRKPKFKAIFDEIYSGAEKAKLGISKLTETEQQLKVTNLQAQFKNLNNQVKAFGLNGQSVFSKLKSQISKLSIYFNGMFIFMTITRQIRQMYNNVVELDTAMVELKKVTDETNSTYERFLHNATSKAKELGSTLTDVVNATTAYARLGYSMEDSSMLGDASIVYKQVADDIDNIDDANKSIISTMKAYGIGVNDVMTIVDKFNAVSNNFAISAGGIGEALQNSASSLVAAGNDLSEGIGIIVAANNVVQNPNEVGTAVKTLSLRIRGAATELEQAGLDTEGMAESVSKLRDELKLLSGVDIMINDSTFKNTFQILQELSKVWSSLSDITQANITELIAGKRQANVVSAIMTNFGDAEKVVQVANNSSGSAMEEHSKHLESLAGKLEILQSNYETLSKSVMDDDFLKGLIDTGSKALEIIDSIIKNLGTLPTLLATISSVLLTKNKMGIFTKDNNGNYNFFQQTKKNNIDIESDKITSAINSCSAAYNNLDEKERNSAKATQQMNDAFKDLNPALTKGVAETGNFTDAQEQLKKNVTESKNSIKLFSGVLTRLKGLAATVGTSLVNFGIGLAISLTISAVVKSINAANEAMEKAADEAKELNNQSKSLADTQQQVLELRDKLADTNTTESEAISIRKQLYEIQDDLIEQYGNEAKGIDLVRDSVDKLNGSFKGLDSGNLNDWYLKNAGNVSSAIDSIYGENSIASLFGVAGANIPNSGNERIKIGENIKREDLAAITKIFTNQIGAENWNDTSDGTYAGTYLLKVGKSVKEAGGNKKDLVAKYDDIIEELQKVQTNAQNEGRDVTEIENIIGQFANAKKYWADDKYQEQLATANEYAKYLVSQNTEQNQAYTALQKAKEDYDAALESDSENEIKSAINNYRNARDTITNLTEKLNTTGNEGAIRDFLEDAVEDSNTVLAKDDFKLKFQADEAFIKTNLEKQLEIFGNGKSISKEDILHYTLKNTGDFEQTDAAFNLIQQSAENANLEIEDFCDVLIELGILEGEVSEESKKLDFTDILDMNTDSMKAVTESLDAIQSAFSTVKDVIADYNDTGVLSINNLQKLIALGDDYIGYLFDENGNLSINEQAYQKLTKAKLDSVKMDILKNTIDNIKKITDETSAQEYLAQKINDTTKATEGYTEAILKSYVADGIVKGGKVKEAVLDLYNTYMQYAALVDNTDTTWQGNTKATNAQTEALENQKTALESLKEAQEDEKEILEEQKSALEDLQAAYEDDKDNIEELIDLTADYVKQTYEDKIDALEAEKNAYKEKIEASKEAIDALESELDAEKDLHDYQESISGKTKDIATTKKQIAALQNSTSVSDRKKLQELKNQLSEQQQDLTDYQYDQSIENRKNALEDRKTQLDEQYDHKEKLLDAEIDKIQKVVDNERQIRTEAMNLIDSRSNQFYNNLWNYVYQYTTKSKFEFDNLWNSAYSALDNYNLGQLNCMQIMDLLEQNIYNTDLQIDILQGHINDVATSINNTSSAIDNVSNSIDILKTSLENATTAKTNFNTAYNGTSALVEPEKVEILLGGGKTYSATGQSRLQSAIAIWREWKQDYDNGQTDRTTYSVQDVYNIILNKYPDKYKLNEYASGTSHSKQGLAIVDEEGLNSEYILKANKGRTTYLPEGSIVFNKDETQALKALANDEDKIQKILNNSDYLNYFGSKLMGANTTSSFDKLLENTLQKTSSNVQNIRNDNKTLNSTINMTVNNNGDKFDEQLLMNKLQKQMLQNFNRWGKYYG